MKSSKLFLLLCLTLILLAGCAESMLVSGWSGNKYYDKFGGFPLGAETFSVKQDNAEIRLLVTYRLPHSETWDVNKLNITVKIIVPKQDLRSVTVKKLSLKAKDESYLYIYNNPAIFDLKGRYPILNYSNEDSDKTDQKLSDKSCLFTVDRNTTEYSLLLDYSVLNPDGTYTDIQKIQALDISDFKIKLQEKPPADVEF